MPTKKRQTEEAPARRGIVRNARGINQDVAPVIQTADREWRDGDAIATPDDISAAAFDSFKAAGLIEEGAQNG